ncbi:hypothetical protein D3C76_607110 [compost metagenome]
MRIPRLILEEQLQRHGWPLLAGTALLLVTLGYSAIAVLPAWQRLQGLSAQNEEASTYLTQIEQGIVAAPEVPSRQLDEFRQRLPAQQEATSAIDRIYALAAKERIVLARGEYALGTDPKTHLARYSILLPVRGNYPQVRRFLHALLTELPAVVLEDVDLQRKRIADTELNGRIRLTLYLSRSS